MGGEGEMHSDLEPETDPFKVTHHSRARRFLDGSVMRFDFPIRTGNGEIVYCYSKSVARRIAEQTQGEILP